MSKQNRAQGRTERAAAIRAAQARQERNRRLAIVVGVVVVLGAIVAAGAWFGGGGDDKPTNVDLPPVAAGTASLKMGVEDAPVTVVIYEDFLCPFCRELEESTRDFLRASAEDGKVLVEYRPINLLRSFEYSARSLNAFAAVLKQAGPEAALRFHDVLFEKQPYEQRSDGVSTDDIADWLDDAGADTEAVRDAMKTQDEEFFDAAEKAMTDAGITGTPTVFINGEKQQPESVVNMTRRIEQAVEQGS